MLAVRRMDRTLRHGRRHLLGTLPFEPRRVTADAKQPRVRALGDLLVALEDECLKSSIILVDYTNQVRAGPVRVRPISMTWFATLAAAVPAALSLGPGSEVREPMAIAVIGGLVVSTSLSLLVVPALYVAADRGLDRVKSVLSRRRTAPGGGVAVVNAPAGPQSRRSDGAPRVAPKVRTGPDHTCSRC